MKTFIILLDGAKGAGKSTVSLLLKDELDNTAFFGLDLVRHLVSDAKANTKNNEIAYNVMFSMLESFLRQGVNVVIDSGVTEERLKKIQEIIEKNNVNFYFFHLSASKEVLWKRIQDRPQCKNPDRERFEYIYDILHKKDFSDFEKIDTIQNSPEVITKQIYEKIKEDLK